MGRAIYLLIITISFSGCMATVGVDKGIDSGITNSINNGVASFRSKGVAIKTIVDAEYKDAFQAVINVFHDLDIAMIKKDYENKLIFGATPASSLSGIFSVASPRCIVFFTQLPEGQIEIAFKHSSRINVYLRPFIIDRIHQELILQKQLK